MRCGRLDDFLESLRLAPTNPEAAWVVRLMIGEVVDDCSMDELMRLGQCVADCWKDSLKAEAESN